MPKTTPGVLPGQPALPLREPAFTAPEAPRAASAPGPVLPRRDGGPNPSADASRPQRGPSPSLQHAVLDRPMTRTERLGAKVAEGIHQMNRAATRVGEEISNSLPLQVAAGGAIVLAAAVPAQLNVSRVAGQSAAVRQAALDDSALGFSVGSFASIGAYVLTQAVFGDGSRMADLADLNKFDQSLTPERRQQMIGLVDGLKLAATGDPAPEVFAPAVQDQLSVLFHLFGRPEIARAAMVRLTLADELNRVLGLARHDIEPFWRARHAECQAGARATAPTEAPVG